MSFLHMCVDSLEEGNARRATSLVSEGCDRGACYAGLLLGGRNCSVQAQHAKHASALISASQAAAIKGLLAGAGDGL